MFVSLSHCLLFSWYVSADELSFLNIFWNWLLFLFFIFLYLFTLFRLLMIDDFVSFVSNRLFFCQMSISLLSFIVSIVANCFRCELLFFDAMCFCFLYLLSFISLVTYYSIVVYCFHCCWLFLFLFVFLFINIDVYCFLCSLSSIVYIVVFVFHCRWLFSLGIHCFFRCYVFSFHCL